MNIIQKSEAIKTGLRKGFQNGSSKMAHRKCYGYEVDPDGELVVNSGEAQVVCWIFEGRFLLCRNQKRTLGEDPCGIGGKTTRCCWAKSDVSCAIIDSQCVKTVSFAEERSIDGGKNKRAQTAHRSRYYGESADGGGSCCQHP